MTQNSDAVRKPVRGKPFAKGGDSRRNPGGRPKEEKEVALAIREHGQELVDKLLELARKGNMVAIKEAFDRGYGKAKQVIELSGIEGKPIEVVRIDPKKLTTEQVELLRQLRAQQESSDDA